MVGHERIVAKLRQTVREKTPLGAYLFSGAEGIGKKTLASSFAAALLCDHPHEGKACMSCPSCLMFASGNHPDFSLIELPEDKASIGIDQIRETVIQKAYVRPFHSARKVFVLDKSECMTPEAQNALLKILEEPPHYVVFLLLTNEKNAMLETIRSRCLKFELLPLSKTACYAYFSQLKEADQNRLALCASFAQGTIGRGKKMLDDAFYELYQNAVSQFCALSTHLSAVSDAHAFFVQNKAQANDIIDFMLVFVRDCLRASLAKNTDPICLDKTQEILKICKKASHKSLVSIMEALLSYKEQLSKNASFSAATLELLMKMQEELYDQGNRHPI